MTTESIYLEEFHLRNGLIYLNHAGVSPWPKQTSEAVKCFAEENRLQGARDYTTWLEIESRLRKQFQTLINARSSDDIALLKNTSEAISVVAYGLEWKTGDNIVSGNQEFPSNRIAWESLAPLGVEFREADLNSASSPEDALFSLVDRRTRLITISSVQYASGLRMDLAPVGAFCKKQGILFCVDAIQSLGAIQFNVQEVQPDFVMADGHKWMLGPEGLALFYCHPDARDRLRLTQYGWHMIEEAGDFERKQWHIARTSRRFECGSPNMMGIHALNASLSLLLELGMKHVEKKVLENNTHLIEMVRSMKPLELITPFHSGRYAGIVTFRCHNVDQTRLYQYLSHHGVICSRRAGGIRFSPHFYTPHEQIDQAIDLVMEFKQ